jgi:AmpE protein
MEFLVILLTWALVRNAGVPSGLQRDDWLLTWRARANDFFSGLAREVRLGLTIGVPCLAILLLEWLFGSHLAGLPLFALELVVLIYSLGRGDYKAQLGRYLGAWQRGDLEAAYQEAVTAVGVDASQSIVSAGGLHNQMRRSVLYLAFERWFAVVFWFYFLGPWAALAYRLVHLLIGHSAEDDRALLRNWLFWIEWLPARLLGLAFALTGNFASCIVAWREHLAATVPVPDLLAGYSMHALEGEVASELDDGPHFIARAAHELREVVELLSRSFIAWLLLFALLQMLR